MILAAHSAIQGFMALTLYQGNGLLVMRLKDAIAWMDAHDQGKNYPETQMDSFLGLYKKIKRTDSFCGYSGAETFAPRAHDAAMKQLNFIRNNFTHCTVSAWSISRAHAFDVCSTSADIIDFCQKSPAFPWNQFDDAEESRCEVSSALNDVREVRAARTSVR